jgi:hypothetical protein
MSLANQDVLRSRLHEVEKEIRERQQLICRTPPPEDLDTGAMIRFEEELSVFTSAAKEAVSLKRRLRLERNPEVADHRIRGHGTARQTGHDAGPDHAA